MTGADRKSMDWYTLETGVIIAANHVEGTVPARKNNQS